MDSVLVGQEATGSVPMARKTSSSRVGAADRPLSSTACACAQSSSCLRSACRAKVSIRYELSVRGAACNRRRRGARRQRELDGRRQGPGQLGDRSLVAERAVVHEPDAVGALLRLLQVVRGEHDGGAVLAQLLHGVPERVAGLDVQPGRGLVEEDQLRAAVHGGGEVEAPLLSAGQLGDPGVGLADEVDDAEDAVDRVRATGELPISRTDSATVRSAENPLSCSMMPIRGPHCAPVRRALAEDAHRARRGLAVAFDDLQGRGLACAVGAEQRVQLARARPGTTGPSRRGSRRT